jgi:hypothetical protein
MSVGSAGRDRGVRLDSRRARSRSVSVEQVVVGDQHTNRLLTQHDAEAQVPVIGDHRHEPWRT